MIDSHKMETKTYSKISRANVDRLRGELANFGIKVPEGDDVEVKGPLGVKMQVTYDETTQDLSLSILEKPGFVSEAQIWRVVESAAGKFVNGGR